MDVCWISIPGDSKQVSAQVVTAEIKRRFPREWLAYTQGDVMPVNGIPVGQLPTLSHGEALRMQAQGIMTIENLRDMSDGVAQGIMGGVGWRKKAAAYLANMAPDEKEAMREELAEVKGQLADFKAMLEKVLAGHDTTPAPRRGRPPKDEAAA